MNQMKSVIEMTQKVVQNQKLALNLRTITRLVNVKVSSELVKDLPSGFVIEADRGTLIGQEDTSVPLQFIASGLPSGATTEIRPEVFPTDGNYCFQKQLEAFSNCVKFGGTANPNAVDAVRTFRIIHAMYSERDRLSSIASNELGSR